MAEQEVRLVNESDLTLAVTRRRISGTGPSPRLTVTGYPDSHQPVETVYK